MNRIKVAGNVRAESVVITSTCCTKEVKDDYRNMPDGLGVYPQDFFAHDKVHLCTQGRMIAGQMIHIYAFKRGKFFMFEAFEHSGDETNYRGTIISSTEEMLEVFHTPFEYERASASGSRPRTPVKREPTQPAPGPSPKGVIISVLRRGRKDKASGLRRMTIGELGAGIKQAYGQSYGKLYRKQFGSMTKYIGSDPECRGILYTEENFVYLQWRDNEPFVKPIDEDGDDTFFFVDDYDRRPTAGWREVVLLNLENIDTHVVEAMLFSLLPIHYRVTQFERCTEAGKDIARVALDSTLSVVKLVEAERAFKMVCINPSGDEQYIGLRVHDGFMEQLGTSLSHEVSPLRRPIGGLQFNKHKTAGKHDVELARRAMGSAIIVSSSAQKYSLSTKRNEEERVYNALLEEVQREEKKSWFRRRPKVLKQKRSELSALKLAMNASSEDEESRIAWHDKRYRWWASMMNVHSHARFSSWQESTAGEASETQRVLFLPPLQLRRLISYNAGIKINAIFLIKAQFHPIKNKIQGARTRFHYRTSQKYGDRFHRWLQKAKQTITYRHACCAVIQANTRCMLRWKRYKKMKASALVFQRICRGWSSRKRVEYIRELLVGDWPKVEIVYERGCRISGIQLHLKIWKCGLHYNFSGYDHNTCQEYKGFLPRWELEKLCKTYPHGVTGSYSLRKRIKVRPTFTTEVLALIVAKLAIVESIKGLGESGSALGEKSLVVDADGRGKYALAEGIQGTYVWQPSTDLEWISEEEQLKRDKQEKAEASRAQFKKAQLDKRRREGRETIAEKEARLDRLRYETEMQEWKENKNKWPRGKFIINEIWNWYREIVNILKVLTTSEERLRLRGAKFKWLRVEQNHGGMKETMKRYFQELDPMRTGYVASWEVEMNLYWLGEDIPLEQIRNFLEDALFIAKGSMLAKKRAAFLDQYTAGVNDVKFVSRLPGNMAGFIDYNDFVDRATLTAPTKHPYKSLMRNVLLRYKSLMNDRGSALRKSEEKVKAKGSKLMQRRARKQTKRQNVKK
jgi:hypothetical protein